MRIRESRDADLAAITAIYGEAVRHGRASFEYEPPSLEEIERRRAAVLQAGFPFLVAEVEDRIGGYAYLGAYRPRPGYLYTVESSVYVDPSARRQGLGKALVAELIARAEAMGKRQMVAVIGDSANVASIKLHEALGFTLIGVMPSVGWKFGQWLDQVLMQRPLGPGDTTPGDA